MDETRGNEVSRAHLPRIMARLARLPTGVSLLGGMAGLALVLSLDRAARLADLRLVPLYVPVLCMACWALGRWLAIVFAILAALVAITPDMLASPTPFGMAILGNEIVRMAAYIFLALIIAAYRRTYDEADLRAMVDGLTGVLNKTSFHAAVARQLASSQRSRQFVLVAYVDFDGFKAVNTAYGHAAGDAALRSFSREAMDAIRGSDLVGRLGGDEFGFLLGAASEQVAQALAHLLHQRLSTALAKTGLPLSCSMGALIAPPLPTLYEADLLNAADALMRDAKAGGKNRVLTEMFREAAPSA